MRQSARKYRLAKQLARLGRDESGTTLVEFAVVLSIFLLLFFGLLDFGRMSMHYAAAERAMHIAARIAAVRPPACPDVPNVHRRGPVSNGSNAPDFGTMCSSGANICADVGTISCAGDATNDTASEIWDIVQGSMPVGSSISNLRFSYTYDSDLGFLGGPFTPIVTVEVQNQTFEFISPLGGLVALAGGTSSPDLGATITFPSMSVSMPGEDLAMGTSG